MHVIVVPTIRDRKSTRLNSSHTEIYTLSLHDALPIWMSCCTRPWRSWFAQLKSAKDKSGHLHARDCRAYDSRSEEHTSELQSHRDLHSFPTRRSSDLDELLHATVAELVRAIEVGEG